MQTEYYTLNDAGQAIQHDIMLEGGVYASRSRLTYSYNGFLLTDTTMNYGLLPGIKITRYTTTGDNISARTIKTEDDTGVTTEETKFFYNGLKNTVGYLNQGISFLGKQNVNLADSSKTTPAPLIGPNPLVFSYDFDEGGRIGKTTCNDGMITIYGYY